MGIIFLTICSFLSKHEEETRTNNSRNMVDQEVVGNFLSFSQKKKCIDKSISVRSQNYFPSMSVNKIIGHLEF